MSEMIRRRAAVVLTVMSLATGCTIARGEVKGLRDAGATHVRMDAPIETSIAALNDLPSHCGPTRDHRVREEEFQVYRVIGTIRHVKRAPDHDIHIVLDDPDRPDAHIIVELPDPDSAGSVKSPYRDRLALAMQDLRESVSGGRSATMERSSRDPCPRYGGRVLRSESFSGRPIAKLHRASSGVEDRAASRLPSAPALEPTS